MTMRNEEVLSQLKAHMREVISGLRSEIQGEATGDNVAISERLLRMELEQKQILDAVQTLRSAIQGNGKPGLNERVLKLEGRLALIIVIGSVFGTSVIGAIAVATVNLFVQQGPNIFK